LYGSRQGFLPMSRSIEINVCQDGQEAMKKIYPRWKGKNLAVHAPFIGGEVERSDYWIITHLGSGKRAAIMYSVSRAIKVAREWDKLFSSMNADFSSEWILLDDWKAAIDRLP